MNKLLAFLLILPFGAHAQERGELALVKKVFAQLQPISIKNNREYCGYIGYDGAGKLVASQATRGRRGSCRAKDPRNIETIIASFHTHGAFSRGYYSEMPSQTDMDGDEEEGIDGWVATPGGRLWYIDTQDMVASQICSIGCLKMDANFEAGDMGKIASSYSYKGLVAKFERLEY
jgi:hypothetical protein